MLLTYLSPIIFFLFFLPLLIQAQELALSPRFLDSVLQNIGFRAFAQPRTGVVYNGSVPANLTGMAASAVRLRSGSFKKRGFYGFREFDLPRGVFENPYVERLVLVYQDLGNWSSVYYSLPGFDHLSPVLGLLSYNGSDLLAKNLPELDIRVPENPILIRFSNVGAAPVGSSAAPMCVFFDLFGSVEFNNLVNGSVCESMKQGHYGIVVEAVAPAPASVTENPGRSGGKNLWLIIGCVVGGILVVLMVSLLVAWVRRCVDRKRKERLEKVATEFGIDLRKPTMGTANLALAYANRTRILHVKQFQKYNRRIIG